MQTGRSLKSWGAQTRWKRSRRARGIALLWKGTLRTLLALMSDCMTISSGQKSLPTIGFLTITRDAEHGLFGGYLVLNSLGRPVEFHCTAPVRPNRAQEILYGPTLEPYLYGERIGPTLLEKSKSVPAAVFIDVAPAIGMRDFVSTPIFLVFNQSVLAAPEAAGSVGQSARHACRQARML